MSIVFKFSLRLTVVFCSIFFIITPGIAGAPDKLLITTQSWEPYTKEVNGVQSGTAVEALACVFEKMGQTYSIAFIPWIRAQAEVREGRAHAFFPAARNNERDEYARLSIGIVSAKDSWYLPKDSNLNPKDPSFKKTARVTAEAGSNTGNWLKKNGFNLTPQPDTHQQLALMLLRKRVDAVLASEAVFLEGLQALNLPSDTFRKVLEIERPLGVYFSKSFLKKSPGFRERFNAMVPECKRY